MGKFFQQVTWPKNFVGDHWWKSGGTLAKGGECGQERQEGRGESRSGLRECHQRPQAVHERGPIGSQMAELKAVQRVWGQGRWGAQKSRSTTGESMLEAQGSLCLKQDYQGSLGIDPGAITLASQKSLRATLGIQESQQILSIQLCTKKSCPWEYL